MGNLLIAKIQDKKIAVQKYEELIKKLEKTNFFDTNEININSDDMSKIREYNITTVKYK
jgi:ribosomal protein L10